MLKSLHQLNRPLFWMWTAPIVLGKVLLSIAVANGIGVGAYDTVLVLLLAYVMAGRFRDIGWTPWLGPVFILVTMLGIPVAVMGVAIARHIGPDDFVQLLFRVGLFTGFANLVLLIVAGSMPGRAAPAEPA